MDEREVARKLLKIIEQSDLSVLERDGIIRVDQLPVSRGESIDRVFYRRRTRMRSHKKLYYYLVGSEMNPSLSYSGSGRKGILPIAGDLIGFCNLGSGTFIAFVKVNQNLIYRVNHDGMTPIDCRNSNKMKWFGGNHLSSSPEEETLSDDSYSVSTIRNPPGKTQSEPLILDGNNAKSSTYTFQETILGNKSNLSVNSSDSQYKWFTFSGLNQSTTYNSPQKDFNSTFEYYCKQKIDSPTLENGISFPYPQDNYQKVAPYNLDCDWTYGFTRNYSYRSLKNKSVWLQIDSETKSKTFQEKFSIDLNVNRAYQLLPRLRIDFLIDPYYERGSLNYLQGMMFHVPPNYGGDQYNSYAFWYPYDLSGQWARDRTEPLAIGYPDRSRFLSAPETYHHKNLTEESWTLEIDTLTFKEEIYRKYYLNQTNDFECGMAVDLLPSPFFYNYEVQSTLRNYNLYSLTRTGTRTDAIVYENSYRNLNIFIGGEDSLFYETREFINEIEIEIDYGNLYKSILDWQTYLNYDTDNIFKNNTIKFYTIRDSEIEHLKAYQSLGACTPYNPDTTQSVEGSTRTIKISARYSPGGEILETPKIILDGERLPVKIADSFLFIVNYNPSGVIEKNNVLTARVGHERSVWYDYPIAFEKSVFQTLENGTWKFSGEAIDGLERTDWAGEWQFDDALMFYRKDERLYIAAIDLNVETADEDRFINIGNISTGIGVKLRGVNRLTFDITSESIVNFFCLDNILPQNRAVIWSTNNCYWLVKHYLSLDQTKVNLIGKKLYISQKVTADQVRRGAGKIYTDRFSANIEGQGDDQKVVWLFDKLLSAPLTGLSQTPIKNDFVSYYDD